MANELTGIVTRLINNITRTVSGAITSSGTYQGLHGGTQYLYTSTKAGILSLAGAISRALSTFARQKSGIVSFLGTLSKPDVWPGGVEPYKALVGTLTWFKGLLHTGVLTLSGAYTYVVERPQRFLAETRTGTQAFLGIASRIIGAAEYAKTGVLSYLGQISRLINNLTRTCTGVLSLIGTYTWTIARAGTVYVIREGSVTIEGWIAYIDVILLRNIGGALSFVGSIAGSKFETTRYTIIRSVSLFKGAVTYYRWGLLPVVTSLSNFVGTITRNINVTHIYQGAFSFVGSLEYWNYEGYLQRYYGNLLSSGVISYLRSVISGRTKSGGLSFSSDVFGYKEYLYYGIENP